MRLHPIPPLLAASLAALLLSYGWAAEPAPAPVGAMVQVRPADIGGHLSRRYAAGDAIHVEIDDDSEGLVVATGNSVQFLRRGYYRQSIVVQCTTAVGPSRAEESIVWIETGDVARVTVGGAMAPPEAQATVTYRTDRTAIRWEYLGIGMPPIGSGRVREG